MPGPVMTISTGRWFMTPDAHVARLSHGAAIRHAARVRSIRAGHLRDVVCFERVIPSAA